MGIDEYTVLLLGSILWESMVKGNKPGYSGARRNPSTLMSNHLSQNDNSYPELAEDTKQGNSGCPKKAKESEDPSMTRTMKHIKLGDGGCRTC